MQALHVVWDKLTRFRKVELVCYLFFSALCVAGLYFSVWADFLLHILLFALCVVALIKQTRRMQGYGKVLHRRERQTRAQARAQYFAGSPSQRKYLLYVRTVLCCWLGFLMVCFAVNHIFAPPPLLFLGGVFLLYALDIIFYSAFCFLNFLANQLFATNIRCCYLCPVRGWDLLMLNLPLLFLWQKTTVFIQVLLFCVFFLSLLGFLLWEYGKFFILPSAKASAEGINSLRKTGKMEGTPCAHCKRSCGEEYNGRRSCMRRYSHNKRPL